MSKNALSLATQAPPPVEYRSPLLEPERFTMMWRIAEAMANARTVGDHLKKSPGDCLRIVEMADRCGQSPFALADHTFFVQGKMALDGQGMASLVNAHPKVVGSLRYEYEGSDDTLSVRVIGRLRGEDHDREVTLTLKQGLADSKGARQRWQQDPEQMLSYAGARKWARRHAPEVTMGLYTPDELQAGMDGGTPMRDITPQPEPKDFGGRGDVPFMLEEKPEHDPDTGEVGGHRGAPPQNTSATGAGQGAPDDAERMRRFWAKSSYLIPNGHGPEARADTLTRAMKKAPDMTALDKLWLDNEEWIKDLESENERFFAAVADTYDTMKSALDERQGGML